MSIFVAEASLKISSSQTKTPPSQDLMVKFFLVYFRSELDKKRGVELTDEFFTKF